MKKLDKADLGTKRVCPNCGARFYDLSKRPIQCPKCAYSFEPEAMFKPRRRQAEAVAEENEAQKGETEDAVETSEDETEVDTDTAEESSGHEDDSDNHGAGMSVVDAEDVSIEDLDDDDVGEEEDDDTILSPDEDEDDDVSGIIDADIEKDEG